MRLAGAVLGLTGLMACATGSGPECRWESLAVDEPTTSSIPAPVQPSSANGSRPISDFVEGARDELAQGEREEALLTLTRGLQVHPGTPALLELRGELLAQAGYRRAAEKDYLCAVKAAPDRADLWRSLGAVQLDLELPAAANQALRRCDGIEPDHPETLVLLARASRLCGQLERAAHLYGRALESSEASACMLVEGASLFAEDRLYRHYPEQVDEAFRWLGRALALEPRHPRAHFVRGLLLERQGKAENAVACYRRSIEIDPYCLGAYTNLALLCAERGECSSSQEMALKAIALENNPHRRRALRQLFEDPGSRELVAELRSE